MNAAWEYPGTGSISANSALFVGFAVGKHVGPLSFNWLVVCSGIAMRPPEFGWRLTAKGNADRLRARDNLLSKKMSDGEVAEAEDMIRNLKPGQCPTPYQ